MPKLEIVLPPKRVSYPNEELQSAKQDWKLQISKEKTKCAPSKAKKIQKLSTWKVLKQNKEEASKTLGNNYRYRENKEGNNKDDEERTLEEYLAKTSMEEIQELLRKWRIIDFPVTRNAASIAYIARDSPSLSLYLQMQKSLPDELDYCCEVLFNDRKITGLWQRCHVVNTTIMASAVLVKRWKCSTVPNVLNLRIHPKWRTTVQNVV